MSKVKVFTKKYVAPNPNINFRKSFIGNEQNTNANIYTTLAQLQESADISILNWLLQQKTSKR